VGHLLAPTSSHVELGPKTHPSLAMFLHLARKAGAWLAKGEV